MTAERGIEYGRLPSGTVTLLFSDIEGSTQPVQRLGDDWSHVLHQHRVWSDAGRGRDWGGIEIGRQGGQLLRGLRLRNRRGRCGRRSATALCLQDWPHGVDLTVRMGGPYI